MVQSSVYAMAWRLHESGVGTEEIAQGLGVHRATLYRWFRYIRDYGIRAFERWMKSCKTRKRRLRIDPRIPALVRDFRRSCDWCGEKIRWWLKETHGLVASVATIYRILGEEFKLSSPWKKREVRGGPPKAERPRHVLQMDLVHLGLNGLSVLTVVDTWTREAIALPLKDREAKSVAVYLPTLKQHFGPIEILQTDNGSEFKGIFLKRVAKWATNHRTIHPGAKEENGFIESFNRTVRDYGVGRRTWQLSEYRKLTETLKDFCRRYNEETPHLSLNLQTPAQFAAKSRI